MEHTHLHAVLLAFLLAFLSLHRVGGSEAISGPGSGSNPVAVAFGQRGKQTETGYGLGAVIHREGPVHPCPMHETCKGCYCIASVGSARPSPDGPPIGSSE